ncbi:molybdate ABC transporter substrate-binding protein [Polynucleobacter paneuropaeus]|uniref:Molybdate ABC transporter substrate-binding protein n=1 Tax=Polynucleobacter paneuropaeus TaxID=2527775 RepID=A0ABX9FEK9_9BURK|nr:molybdate ABC transporter substrate-binding protein [Polynucleobacter paneuropaeus]AWW48188.1 molybdate ABC transporter substrate-binding protein [Polynucleobacter paneuropaeus]RAZ43034.1 molybdate ABC transporter substrate-binding protein [Polynucleobacter paneuropaeus]
MKSFSIGKCFGVLSFWLLLNHPIAAQTTSVAVAANMKDAFTAINSAFIASGKPELRIVYGSSGNFASQIMNGAPFNVFISADESYPLELYRNGKTVDAGKVYAIGKLVMLTKNSSGIKLNTDKTELARVIAKANKIAIAKPELAPYGRAAVEYLKAIGLWELAKDKLVYADNVGMATMFVSTGAADLGFTSLSLAKSPELLKDTSYLELEETWYAPIKQRMVLIKGAPPEASDLYQFMQSTKARQILIQYGYSLPGNQP